MTESVPEAERSAADYAVYVDGQRYGEQLPLTGAATTAEQTGGFVWVELHEPTARQLTVVARVFGLPALAVADALAAHQRPKAERHDKLLFVVVKPVRYVDSHEVVDVAELALFIGEHFVVSVRHGHSTVLGRVRADLNAGRLDAAVHGLAGPAGVLHRTLEAVVEDYLDVVTAIDTDIADIEAQVFGHTEADHSERIYKLKREVMEFRRAAMPLRDTLETITYATMPNLDAEAAPYFKDVLDSLLRAADGIDGHNALLSDVLQANVARVTSWQSAIGVQQNEDMRKMSAWAAIGLVPTAIAGVYGMNFDNMPELHYQFGYFAVMTLIIGTCVSLYVTFRRNGWL